MTDPTSAEVWVPVVRDLIAAGLVIFTVIWNARKTRAAGQVQADVAAVKMQEIHVLVNSRLHEALQEVADLKAQVRSLLPEVPNG